MTKQEFLGRLEQGLKGLPEQEIEERIAFYSEMIDDLMEEGFSETEAVAKIGTVEETVAKNVVDNHFEKISTSNAATGTTNQKRKLKAWEIVLLVVGSPVWVSLLATAGAVVISLYAVLWAVIVSLWAAVVSLVAGSLAGIIQGIIQMCNGYSMVGLAIVGAGLLCAGLSIFAFFGALLVTKYTISGTAKFALWIKNRFAKKECAK